MFLLTKTIQANLLVILLLVFVTFAQQSLNSTEVEVNIPSKPDEGSEKLPETSGSEISDPEARPAGWAHVDWLIGEWYSQFDGKVVWPTMPTQTYGEWFKFEPAPFSLESGKVMLRYEARSWSHSTKDRLLDTYGYMIVEPDGTTELFTTMNNGFSTYEKGTSKYGLVALKVHEIGRMNIARQIPVESMSRQFNVVDSRYIEQILSMRTAQHPTVGELEHARILYQRYEVTTTTTTTTPLPTIPNSPPIDVEGADSTSSPPEESGLTPVIPPAEDADVDGTTVPSENL